MAAKHSIHTGAGVIDADYRGCVFVLLFNLGKEDFVGESRDAGFEAVSDWEEEELVADDVICRPRSLLYPLLSASIPSAFISTSP